MHHGICICEQDETATRVHKALVWDIPFFASGGYVPESVSPSTKALILSGAVSLNTVGQRSYDPPKDARDWAKIVSGFCTADTHFPNVDLEMELGRPVYTSSDPEKIAENEREAERAAFENERMPWRDRFEPRGEDSLDRLTRAQRHERGLREATASNERASRMNAGREVTATRHTGSMKKRWVEETPAGQRWKATRQRIEKERWQEFYRLARQLGRNPATPAAKGWVETVGMDAAIAALKEAIEKQPVAA